MRERGSGGLMRKNLIFRRIIKLRRGRGMDRGVEVSR